MSLTISKSIKYRQKIFWHSNCNLLINEKSADNTGFCNNVCGYSRYIKSKTHPEVGF